MLISISVLVGLSVYYKYPFGVKKYKTISIGMTAAESAGDDTVIAPPYNVVPPASFYAYALGDKPICIGDDCGLGGYFVECLGGWLSSYKDMGEVVDYGLRYAGVDINTERVITVANKAGKIVGIPGVV